MGRHIIRDNGHRRRLQTISSVIKEVFGGEALLVKQDGAECVHAIVEYGETRVDLFCNSPVENECRVGFDIYGPNGRKFSEVNNIRYAPGEFDGQSVLDRINLEITNAEAIYENPE